MNKSWANSTVSGILKAGQPRPAQQHWRYNKVPVLLTYLLRWNSRAAAPRPCSSLWSACLRGGCWHWYPPPRSPRCRCPRRCPCGSAASVRSYPDCYQGPRHYKQGGKRFLVDVFLGLHLGRVLLLKYPKRGKQIYITTIFNPFAEPAV